MDKINWIIKTLSRTNRKDYENYVINAVWNRLIANGVTDLKPVSQQFIRTSNKRCFVDLYFPQLIIGIECHEIYHDSELQKQKDEERKKIIEEKFKEIENIYVAEVTKPYTELIVKVYVDNDEDKNNDNRNIINYCDYDKTENDINDAVKKIIEKRKEVLNGKEKFTEWCITPEEFFKEKDEKVISVNDDVTFRTIAQGVNTVLGTDFDNLQKCARKLENFNTKPKGYKDYEGVKANFKKFYGDDENFKEFETWFPKHSKIVKIKDNDDNETEVYVPSYNSEKNLYINVWSKDGKKILTKAKNKIKNNENSVENIKRLFEVSGSKNAQNEYKVISFIRISHPVFGGNSYKFAGVYTYSKIGDDWELREWYSDEFPILNPEINPL